MKTTIRNKQTGETLTGHIESHEKAILRIRINGCQGWPNDFNSDDWEILPPSLPTGIGAVVKDGSGRIFVRTFRNSINPWLIACGTLRLRESELVDHNGPVTILSEGVTL